MAPRQHSGGLAVARSERNLPYHTPIPRTGKRAESAIPTFIVVLDVKTNSLSSTPLKTSPGRRSRTHDDAVGIESLIPLDRFKIQLLIRLTLRTQQVQKERFRIQNTSGETRIIESETGILFDSLQQISKVVVTSRDITHQKDTREAIHESERRLRAMVDGSLDVVAFIDKRGRIVFAGSTGSILGYTEKELIGRNALLLVHPDDRTRTKRSFLDLAAHPSGTSIILHRIRHHDGSWRTLQGTGTNLLADSVVGAIVVRCRDITEQQDSDVKAAFLESLALATDDAVIGASLDGTIVSWNKGAEFLYGYTSAEAVGRPLSLIEPYSQGRASGWPALLDRIRKGETVSQSRSRRITKDGRTINVAAKISPVHLHAGELIGMTTITREVTTRRNVRAERDRLLAELHSAREEVSALQGLLPICAWCKRVRDDDGYWGHIESYFESHSQMQFTHGICPECIAKYHQRSDKNITDVEGL